MQRALLLAIAIALFCSSAPAQAAVTQDQCRQIANGLSKMAVALDDGASTLDLKWDQIIPNLTGQFLASAQRAKNAQIAVTSAMKAYKIALEDMAREAQLCSR